MDNQNLDELSGAGRNIQALAMIHEQFGCSLREAIDVLSEHHSRLRSEREQPNQRSSTDDDGPGHQV
ncbi:hypothetical protein [Micromonospora sp. NPDC005172]|uniref:hypothetical protein n=1 Tax=Micromonospora sp. NPDC005172 TaxID=3156867 RepID=UPI0033AA5FA5